MTQLVSTSVRKSIRKTARDVALVAIPLALYFYDERLATLGLIPVLRYFWDRLRHSDHPGFQRLRRTLGYKRDQAS